MENLKIGFLLHFYQPWWQTPPILKKIVQECYQPITKLLERESGFCFSVNINYSLLELLDGEFREIISVFKMAAQERKIEFLGSTAYHPIMPLIPKDLQILQMLADSELKKILWGIEKNCDGIFLPEMAFSQNIVPNLKKCGYLWTILDDVPFKAQYNYVPFNHTPAIKGNFKVFLRSNYWSNQIAAGHLDFGTFRRKLNYEFPQWTKNQPAYLIIALDAETFGHHHGGLIENFLEPMVKEWGGVGENILRPVEEIGLNFPVRTLVKINDGSWSTSEEDYWQDNPFPLWNSKFNPYHQDLWRLVNLALQHFGKAGANLDCLKIVSSCQWWWISGRPWWKPKFMKIGARKAMEIVRRYGSAEEIAEAEKIFNKLAILN